MKRGNKKKKNPASRLERVQENFARRQDTLAPRKIGGSEEDQGD